MPDAQFFYKTIDHSLGLSLILSRTITVSRRNRPGNGTHTQHASRRVLYSTRGVPSETNNDCAALSAVITCLVSAAVVLFLIRERVCDITRTSRKVRVRLGACLSGNRDFLFPLPRILSAKTVPSAALRKYPNAVRVIYSKCVPWTCFVGWSWKRFFTTVAREPLLIIAFKTMDFRRIHRKMSRYSCIICFSTINLRYITSVDITEHRVH